MHAHLQSDVMVPATRLTSRHLYGPAKYFIRNNCIFACVIFSRANPALRQSSSQVNRIYCKHVQKIKFATAMSLCCQTLNIYIFHDFTILNRFTLFTNLFEVGSLVSNFLLPLKPNTEIDGTIHVWFR